MKSIEIGNTLQKSEIKKPRNKYIIEKHRERSIVNRLFK